MFLNLRINLGWLHFFCIFAKIFRHEKKRTYVLAGYC